MNARSFKKIKWWGILICIVGILFAIVVDVPKLENHFTTWNAFGIPPINIIEIQYFIPDTPNSIGFKDPINGEFVSCTTTVAYVKSGSEETYRCCDTGKRISCLPTILPDEIPTPDPECTDKLQNEYGIPYTLKNTSFFRLFARCWRSDDWDLNEITIVKINNNDQIYWKYLSRAQVIEMNILLKCFLTPLFLFIIIIIFFIQQKRSKYKEKP